MMYTHRLHSLAFAAIMILRCFDGDACVLGADEFRSDAGTTTEDGASPLSSPPSTAATARACVLLTNGNVMFGAATQQGEWVIIRNGAGSETRLARTSVACWADNVDDLYQFRVDRRRKGDIEALLHDARWCLNLDAYHLVAEALSEIYEIDPANAQARLIETQLRRRTAPPETPTPTIPVSQTTYYDPDSSAPVDIASTSAVNLRFFSSHIQPMLANRCGQCHSHTSGRDWSLFLPPRGARPSSAMTRDNLQATLKFISTESPSQSPLLVNAITAHGGSQTPLDARDVKATETLRAWINEAAASIITPMSEDGDAKLPPPVIPLDSLPDTLPQVSAETNLSMKPTPDDSTSEPVASDVPRPVVPSTSTSGTQPSASRLPQVANPFDPEIFNRRFHPPQPAE